MPIVDNWWLYDNSEPRPNIISKRLFNKPVEIIDVKQWHLLENKYCGDTHDQ